MRYLIITCAVLMAFDAVLFDGQYLVLFMQNVMGWWHWLTSFDWRWEGIA